MPLLKYSIGRITRNENVESSIYNMSEYKPFINLIS